MVKPRFSRLMAPLMLLAVTALMLLVYRQLDRPVSKVVVSGELDAAERAQIREVVAASLDGGVLRVDLSEVREGILGLSWPRFAAVRRGWPDTLHIEVEKPAAIARWQDAFLLSDGRVVQLPDARLELPAFDCAVSSPRTAMEVFHRLSEAAAPHALRITRVTENELGEWSLTFDGGLILALGAESLRERMDRFLAVYARQLAARSSDVARADARYDNGVAVRWRALDPVPRLVAATGDHRRTEQF